MALTAGDLNCKITIQRRTTGVDEIGQPLDTWEDVVSVWADIRTTTGMGTITRMQENVPASVERYSIRIRYREGLNAGMRVVAAGQYFDIRQIRMDFAGRVWTDLICEVGGNDG